MVAFVLASKFVTVIVMGEPSTQMEQETATDGVGFAGALPEFFFAATSPNVIIRSRVTRRVSCFIGQGYPEKYSRTIRGTIYVY